MNAAHLGWVDPRWSPASAAWCKHARMAVIETEGLTKRYGGKRGIEDVTFSVEAGEVFGFLGPNGAGKTTTIRTLLDLLHPTSGSARIFGLDSHRDSVAIRARLGNLPGDFGYGKQSTGREALRLLARLRGIDGLGRAEALAERFHADLDRPLGQLSRGNRQKIGLILATFHSPELLILDEPTSGLDPLMQEEFLALVGEERERGCTVLLSSHELDEVERVCDRVGIVRDGQADRGRADRTSCSAGRGARSTLELAEPSDLVADLRALPGVTDLEAADGKVSFKVAGDLDPVLKAIAATHVTDMELTHPTLEEVFLTYYGRRRDDARSSGRWSLTHLSDRRRSLLAWGLPLGLWSAFIVMIFPSVEGALSKAVQNYPPALKEAFGIGELTSVEQYLHAEMLSLIVPLAIGYLAVRAVASGLSGRRRKRPPRRLALRAGLPPAPCRGELRRDRGRARDRPRHHVLLTGLGSLVSGADLSLGSAIAGYANVWPLALVFAGLGIVATGFSLRTSVVTGAVAGVLVTMYVIDLIGRLDTDLSGIRYVSVFKYYGNAIEDGIDPVAFVGVTAVAVALAALGAWLFDRRDLAA